MAGFGRLPGVGLPPRRRSNHTHPRQEGNQWFKPSMTSMDILDDEGAHKARERLAKRLGRFRPCSRSSSSNHYAKMGSSSKQLGRPSRGSFFSLSRNEIDVCAICLENFEAGEEAMELACAHKFHSHCLSPWLHAHSDCPYCRTNVSVCS